MFRKSTFRIETPKFAVIEGVIISLLVLLAIVYPDSQVRYAIYAYPVVSILRVFSVEPSIDRYFVMAFLGYALIILLSILSSGNIDARGLENAIFISVPIMAFFVSCVRDEKAVGILATMIGVFSVFYFLNLFLRGDFIFDLGESRSTFETTLSFIFAPIALFYYFNGNNKVSFIFFILTIVGSKRIALLGLIFGYIYLFIAKRGGFRSKSMRVPMIFLFMVIGFYAINILPIANLIIETLDINMSVNQFTQGRAVMSYALNEELNNRPILGSIFGSGPGTSDIIAQQASSGLLNLPHNDFLKIIIDYGYFGFTVISILLSVIFSRTHLGVGLFLFLIVCYISDNLLVYASVMTVVYFCFMVDLSRRKARHL